MAGPAPQGASRGWLVRASLWLSELALAAMAIMVVIAVASRSVLGTDIEITEEVGGYLLVAMTFLSLAAGQAYQVFHRVELVQMRLSPRGRALSALLFDVLSLALLLVLDVYFVRLVWSSYAGENVALTLLATPLWIPELVLPIGTTMAALVLLREIAAGLRRWRTA